MDQTNKVNAVKDYDRLIKLFCDQEYLTKIESQFSTDIEKKLNYIFNADEV